MSLNKTCRQCDQRFVVEDEDLAFYKKMSPTFAGPEGAPLGGKTFEMPTPTLCPECRDIRRSSFRNERSLYKRKCDKTGKEIVSVYSPDKTDYKVYEISEWYKDDWDPMDYGRDFDFSRPFFEQFDELMHDVPRLSLFNTNTENCEYANYVEGIKNCYMTMVTYYGTEDSHFCYRTYTSKDNMDLNYAQEVEKCYDCVFLDKCYNCRYSTRLTNCRDCYFSISLTGCSDCILCSNLNRKQYCINNKQLTKEEYEKRFKEFDFTSHKKISKYREEFEKLRINSVVKFADQVKCEDCIGDNLIECKNVKYAFNSHQSEDCKYLMGEKAHNVYDSRGGSFEWCYECNHTGLGVHHTMFSSGVIHCTDMYYCETCHGSHDCFGCVGLRNKEYCVFNKQYTKEEYEKIVAKIIEHMQKTQEWGEFFPNGSSPFGYNEALVNSLFPKTKEEALKIGMKWQDNDYSIEFKGSALEPHDDISDYIESEEEREKLLAGTLKCEISGKPFRIMPQELAFYINNKIPIPHKHYDTRYSDRLKLEFTRRLYHRKCMNENCSNEFETTYAPERPEKVYCEKCYQKVII